MNNIKSRTILFITGAFAGVHTWDKWIPYYENKGYTCIVPPWPHKDDKPPANKKAAINSNELSNVRLSQLLAYYTDIAEQQKEKPIAIGHALGGLIVQLLLQQSSITAGVAMRSLPPINCFSMNLRFVKYMFKALGFFSATDKPYIISFDEWQRTFTNGSPYEEQKRTYDEYVVPQSKRVFRDTLSSVAKIDFNSLLNPLLILAGSADRVVPSAVNYSNYSKYSQNDSTIIANKEFKDKNHFSYALPGWETEADYILDWLDVMHNPARV